MSPDTDVYVIGLALQSTQTKEVIVQLSAYSARELRLLIVKFDNGFTENDHDLGRLNSTDLPKIQNTSIYLCLYRMFIFLVK